MQNLHLLLCLSLLTSSFLVVFSINPIISVIFLIFAFCNAAFCLILFNVDFFGITFIIIYVGAIAVLFLFVVMMLNIKLNPQDNLTKKASFYVLTAFLIESFCVYTFFNTSSLLVNIDTTKTYLYSFDSFNNIDALGQSLYNFYLVCFLLCGLVLLVALVGSIVLTLKFNRIQKTQAPYRQLARADNFLTYFK